MNWEEKFKIPFDDDRQKIEIVYSNDRLNKLFLFQNI